MKISKWQARMGNWKKKGNSQKSLEWHLNHH